MPTDLPPDYKPAPPEGADSRDPAARPMPGGPTSPGDLGTDAVDGVPHTGSGVPEPGLDTGPALPGSIGGDSIDTGIPGTVPAI